MTGLPLTLQEVRQEVERWRMRAWQPEWPDMNEVAAEFCRLEVDELLVGRVLDDALVKRGRPPHAHEVAVDVERRLADRSPADRIRAEWPHIFAERTSGRGAA